MGRTIGIDLGTTNTVVAILQNGRPRVLEDDKGYKVLPSVVSWKGDERYIVGQPAKNLILTQPDRTVYAIKRLLGRRYDSPEVVQAMKRMAYRIEPADDGAVQVGLGDLIMTPSEVSAIILSVARQIATKATGEPVDEAVITVPAYFNHAQRAATMEAAQLAGLKCERLLNEPTAAALAYGYRKDIEKTLVIFDLGGGTFDVSVLHMSHGIYEILSTSGDTFLGGEDVDYLLVDHLADEFQRRERLDLRKDPLVIQRLKDAAERAKCELSFTDYTTVLVPQVMGGKNLEHRISRSTLERLANDLIMRTVEITKEAISSAGLQTSDIDDVILVGGQTRMPRVREVITNLFGKEPSRSVHPEEVVAIGAAVHAESLDNPEVSRTLLIDVTPFDLGIDAAGGFFSTVIDRNAKIPITQTRTFTTVTDNQETVRITVRQGESRDSEQNEFLGEFVLSSLRPAPRMVPKLDVTFRIDANGMLHVTATERATGERQQIVVRNYADVAAGTAVAPDRVDASAGSGSGISEAVVTAAPTPEATAEAAEGKRPGFLKRLFSRKKPKAAPPPPEPEAAPEQDEVAAAGAALIGAAIADNTPEPVDVEALEEIPLEPLPDLASEAIAPVDEPPEAPPAPDLSAAAPQPYELGDEDLFAMPADDDDLFAMPADDDDLFAMPADDDLLSPASDALAATDEDLLGPSQDDLIDSPVESADDFLAALEQEGLLASAPAAPAPSEAASAEDFLNEIGQESDVLADLGLDALGTSEPEPAPPPRPRRRSKRPAKLKISYRRVGTFLREYQENLAEGGTFIKTPKPLPTGRECLFQISVPGLEEPITFRGEVVWSSRDEAVVNTNETGMRVRYTMSDEEQAEIRQIMADLSA